VSRRRRSRHRRRLRGCNADNEEAEAFYANLRVLSREAMGGVRNELVGVPWQAGTHPQPS